MIIIIIDKRSQNVQDSRRSHKHYRENHENLESEIHIKRKKLSGDKDP